MVEAAAAGIVFGLAIGAAIGAAAGLAGAAGAGKDRAAAVELHDVRAVAALAAAALSPTVTRSSASAWVGRMRRVNPVKHSA